MQGIIVLYLKFTENKLLKLLLFYLDFNIYVEYKKRRLSKKKPY